MSGPKTNEREGTRAVLRWCRVSPYKVREVLDLIRGQHVERAAEILRFSERDAAHVVTKLLASAVANAITNDRLPGDELYVSACFADEGPTAKRFRFRARGRAARIRKRGCHITVIVSRLEGQDLARWQDRQRDEAARSRARRVARSTGAARA
ncbi:MAG: 50S ribosomal protein L22, partial [Acidimicrobiales bacterium]